eukprot:gnl/TRDRNA2_/TRDRNA2_168260_c0_seq1.p1 gnl/TRDRNA2_/TRDRNA2_168260_c0~~gnl/TRDRNA2_/TRDRNA2_168260_c0_seq1.p1  ORF type:complete len:961 (+),score=90.86 gnl/TRDRNA2_/TRDRNA2_168260_c0_seq1:2-2884(+)
MTITRVEMPGSPGMDAIQAAAVTLGAGLVDVEVTRDQQAKDSAASVPVNKMLVANPTVAETSATDSAVSVLVNKTIVANATGTPLTTANIEIAPIASNATSSANATGADVDTTTGTVTTEDAHSDDPNISNVPNISKEAHSDEIQDHSHVPGFRILDLDGFQHRREINGRYVERAAPINGTPSFWTTTLFVYWCATDRTWRVYCTADTCLQKAQAGCWAYAKSPPNYDILSKSNFSSWSEHDDHGKKWVTVFGAGKVGMSTACGAYRAQSQCSAIRGCTWQPLSGLCTTSWHILGSSRPTFNDTSQGVLATCYFLAAIAAVAHHHPEVIEGLFVHRERWNLTVPVYTTRLLLLGQPKQVAVDSWVPVDSTGRALFVKHNNGNELWPLVLEKAWAKTFGSFKAIEYGWSFEAMRALVQAPVEIYLHEGNNEAIWAQLSRASQQGFPTAAFTGRKKEFGLTNGHVYSVLGAEWYAVDGVRQKTVVLYNPYSYSRYNGQVRRDSTDGRFRMLLQEYEEAFFSTTVAEVRRGYVISPMVLSRRATTRISSKLQFQVKDDKPFSIQVEWPSYRLLEKSGCKAIKLGAHLEVSDGIHTYRAESARNDFKVSNMHVNLPGKAGTYNVTVFAEAHGHSWMKEIVLNAYASESISFQHLPVEEQPRNVLLSGFAHANLNAWYVVSDAPADMVNGVETYWTVLGGHFLYWSSKFRDWRVGAKSALRRVRGGEDIAFAHSPANLDILDPSLIRDWHEWTGSEWEAKSPSKRVVSLTNGTLRIPTLTLSNFQRTSLSSRYLARQSPKINGHYAYWSSNSQYVLFICPKYATWIVTFASELQAAARTCSGLARSPNGIDILHPEGAKGWFEWNGRAWRELPDAGVMATQSSFLEEAPVDNAETCDRLLNRLDELNNWRDISLKGEDPLFPRNLTSIAKPGQTCGDAAADIQDSCEKYNAWSNFDAIMAKEAPA